MKLASSNVTTMTPDGDENQLVAHRERRTAGDGIRDGEHQRQRDGALGPPKVITAAERQRSGVILRRLPVDVARKRSMAATQMKRSVITTRVTSRITDQQRYC